MTKDQIRLYNRQYRSTHRKEINEQKKTYYANNKEREKLRVRDFQDNNPELIMLKSARHRARRRGVPCTILACDISIPKYCPVLNVSLSKSRDKASDFSPSLDCVIPALGYVRGNTRVISNLANRIKTNLSPDKWEYVQKVANDMRNQCKN